MNTLPIDKLSDQELAAVNKSHTWVTGTKDSRGRFLGCAAKKYDIPAWHVVSADKFFGLSGKSVVEFGSLEGAHTVGLARLGATVTALEGRDENIVKTKLRASLYGVSVKVLKADLEKESPPKADVFFHSGVLYHLQDPASHLTRMAPLCQGLFLNTHYTKKPNNKYTAGDGKIYPCWIYPEPQEGYKSGLRLFSRWLPLEDLVRLLRPLFARVEILRDEIQSNGPRVSIACAKS